MAKEKEGTRRRRDEPEKVMKQWVREQADSERDLEDESSYEDILTAVSEQEEDRQKEAERTSSSRRGLGATGRDSGEVAKRPSGELGVSTGETGRKVSELNRRESREIYRRSSDLEQSLSEGLIGKESGGQKESLSEAGRTELEERGKAELGEMKTENEKN